MEYYRTYIGNYSGGMNIEKFLDNEVYDKLSIMEKGESPVQWRSRVKT
jgi:hypothetical protein